MEELKNCYHQSKIEVKDEYKVNLEEKEEEKEQHITKLKQIEDDKFIIKSNIQQKNEKNILTGEFNSIRDKK
jgi:hypothetical protein